MDDKLLNYYERELTFIREMGAEFAGKYPKIAGRLQLEADKCEDPFTERLIEAFAFISGRIHKKIDDDFPEITESLLNILYPHYVNPIPSMSVVGFDPVKQNLSEAGYLVEKGTKIYSKPVAGTPCEFSTCYPVNLWPVEIVSANLSEPKYAVPGAQQVINLQLQTFNELSLSDLNWQSLRFFLNGPSQHIFHLYELLFNNICHLELEAKAADGKLKTISLAPDHLCPVGFGEDENLLPYSKRSFPGYLMLFEYFVFAEKFLFFDLNKLDTLTKEVSDNSLNIRIYLDRTAKSNLVVNAETFRLNATPVVNLFQRIAEPIRLEQRQPEYRVIADVRRQTATEIYTVDRVNAAKGGAVNSVSEYKPFYSLRHHLEDESSSKNNAFWHSQRRPSGKKGDNGTEVYLSFTDLDFTPSDPGVEILTLNVTCTNRDLPARLPFGDVRGDFDMESAAPVARICSLIKPTPACRPALGGALQWRLISHLSLNYLSIVQDGEDGLKELLKLYDFENSPSNQQQIAGIVSLESQFVTRRVGPAFCRGVQTTITLDEDKFVGTGLMLFACVLERFLGQYVSVNSFSQLVVRTLQRKEILKQWPPRNGNQILL